MKLRIVLPFLALMMACQQTGQPADTTASKDSTAMAGKETVAEVPLFRDSVSKEPVQQYRVPVGDGLNDWYFSVKLFETEKTFHYLIKLQYEEIRGEDTLRLPNFGIMPKPEIQPGTDRLSCIIGFLDKNDMFREYKKVYIKDGTLKISALRHYAVATYATEKPAK